MMFKNPYPIALAIAFLLINISSFAWQYPGGDAGGQRFSQEQQINKHNVQDLEQAWSFSFNEPEAKQHTYSLQVTPLYLPKTAGGHVVMCSPFGRIIALDPTTGRERWRYDSGLDESAVKNHFKCRGISWWEDPTKDDEQACKHRLLMAVIDRRIVAIDAVTGLPCQEFGQQGVVRLFNKKRPATVFSTSPPVVINEHLIIGSQIEDFNSANMPVGGVQAIDVRTGTWRWSFSAIPESTQANAQWPANARKVSGAANVWAPMSVDAEHDLVFLPTSSPSPDYYGVFRPGDNGYANSIVALQASTGNVVWHYQLVHHDLWDYDLPAQPVLTTITKDGQTIPALVQTTKQGLIFMFNRLTGEPIYEIEERPVASSLVKGEITSPTQPFPVKPQPLLNHKLTPQDAWGFTPWDRGKCRDQLANLRNEGIYTPFGTQPALYNPSALGGMNWGGAAVSQQQQLLIVNLSNTAMFGQLLPIEQANSKGHWNPALTQINAMQGTPYAIVMGALVSPLGIPCSPPPWGKLAAVDLSTGDIVWQQTLGSVHEMGPVTAPFEIELGTPNLGGPLLTASGLVFIGATMDRRFRAFDSSTGEKLWTATLPFDGSASPMSYSHNGRQYVVIAAGGQIAFGRPMGDKLIAYALPN